MPVCRSAEYALPRCSRCHQDMRCVRPGGRLDSRSSPAEEGSCARSRSGSSCPIMQFGPERITPRWTELRAMALRRGDRLRHALDARRARCGAWRTRRRRAPGTASRWPAPSRRSTSRIKVGTWVLSALHRNPGIIAKTAETLDEISGGRFVFGLGAGHDVARPGARVRAAGGPDLRPLRGGAPDHRPAVADRPCRLRGRVPRGPRPAAAAGRPAAERDPAAHRRQRAQGPAPRRAPRRHLERLRRGAGPRGRAGAAARDASTRSARRSAAIPATIGRGAGVSVNPLQPAGWRETSSPGPPEAIADALRTLPRGRLHAGRPHARPRHGRGVRGDGAGAGAAARRLSKPSEIIRSWSLP